LPRIRTNYDQFITKSVTASREINVTEYFEALRAVIRLARLRTAGRAGPTTVSGPGKVVPFWTVTFHKDRLSDRDGATISVRTAGGNGGWPASKSSGAR
jgi:hypothetical protein